MFWFQNSRKTKAITPVKLYHILDQNFIQNPNFNELEVPLSPVFEFLKLYKAVYTLVLYNNIGKFEKML